MHLHLTANMSLPSYDQFFSTGSTVGTLPTVYSASYYWIKFIKNEMSKDFLHGKCMIRIRCAICGSEDPYQHLIVIDLESWFHL